MPFLSPEFQALMLEIWKVKFLQMPRFGDVLRQHRVRARESGDRLRDAMQRLHAGAALAVRVERADPRRQAAEPRDMVRADEGQLAGAHDIAEADVLDQHRLDLGVGLPGGGEGS